MIVGEHLGISAKTRALWFLLVLVKSQIGTDLPETNPSPAVDNILVENKKNYIIYIKQNFHDLLPVISLNTTRYLEQY